MENQQNTPFQVHPGPLTPEQSASLNQVLATLSPVQAAWLAGYLSGQLGSGAGAGAVVAAPAAVAGIGTGTISSEPLTILVGSQTGNAEEVAESALKQAKAKGLNAKMVSMSDFKPKKLKDEKNLMLIVSTHGEGDPPDNAEDLHEFVQAGKAKLNGMRFSVLSLGDTSYEYFCQTGKDFDAAFEKLGGKRVVDRVDCDVDFEDMAEKWIADSLAAFEDVLGAGGGTAVAVPGVNGAAPAVESQYNKKNPFEAPVLELISLNGRGSAKDTRHLEISLEGSGLTYEPGDALGVYPVNNPKMVEAMLAATGLAANAQVNGKSLADALTTDYDITTLSRPIVEKYNALDPKSRMKPLLDDKKKAVLREYLDGREIIDLLEDFPIEGITAEQLVGLFRKMPPRLYSIASSLKSVPDEVHLTVGVTRYETNGKEREGVCSTFLSDRLDEDPDARKVRVFVDHNKNFKLPPDPNTPIIMIGPGTGVAPFRAFMQEREETDAEGKSWMFFGDQHFTTDFLYQVEWQGWLKDGVLTRMDVAFSRDQEHKVYVQHRMREHAEDLYRWIQEGAVIYVCGDAEKMAEDVHHALSEILAEQGGMSAEDAKAKLKAMQKEKRYQRDVY